MFDDIRNTSDLQPMWLFAINCLIGFGEFAVPVRWLYSLDQGGDYPTWFASLLAFLGIFVGCGFTVWLLARLTYYIVTFQFVGDLPDH